MKIITNKKIRSERIRTELTVISPHARKTSALIGTEYLLVRRAIGTVQTWCAITRIKRYNQTVYRLLC